MNKRNNLLIVLSIFILTCLSANANNYYINNLRTKFINNSAYIYTINPRTFGAVDYNKNDIIEIELGELKGTFINAIPKLKTLANAGINTVYLLPITKVGKLKALGTAGSLYAMDSFDTINPQLLDETDFNQDIKAQAKKFVQAAHKLKMSVIVDLPSCGSYDMSLEKPNLFVKDKNGNAVIPADWTDVRLFKVYDDNGQLNMALVDEYKKFVDLAFEIKIDGIRADVAAIKPAEFWKIIIDYARAKDPEFLFLAEASPNWTNPAKGYAPYATVEELLTAGFDGFYSDWQNLKEIKNNAVFMKKLQDDLAILDKFNGQKSMIANFATHDQISPALYGTSYWSMVNWLNMALPVNPYILDGFPTGDRYIYGFENQPAKITYTDDDSYFVHKGKMDIFNFSRAPIFLDKQTMFPEYQTATMFRYRAFPLVISKKVEPLKTNNPLVFAFKKQDGDNSIIVVGSLSDNQTQLATVKVPKLKTDDFIFPFVIKEPPLLKRGKFDLKLNPYEVQVFAIKKTVERKKIKGN